MKTKNEVELLNKKLEEIKPFVSGRGKEVADKAGMEYVTYHYYMRGLGRNPEKCRRLLNAAKSVAKKMAAQIEQL